MTHKEFTVHFNTFWTEQEEQKSVIAGNKFTDYSYIKQLIKDLDRSMLKPDTMMFRHVHYHLLKSLAAELIDVCIYKTHLTFDEVKNESAKVLVNRAAEYADDEDRLANFKSGAKNKPLSPFDYGWCLPSKHLDALLTSIDKNTQRSIDFWLEKTIDPINYCILLMALENENR